MTLPSESEFGIQIPRAMGFRMPAEWEPHSGCWMAWPVPGDTWGEGLEAAQRAYANVVHAVSRFEPVVVVADPGQVNNARRLLSAEVRIEPMPLNDSWMRDIGPTFLTDAHGRLAGVDWQFNGWGLADVEYDLDDAVAGAVLLRAGAHCIRAPFILEGGSIHVDGVGTLLTTEQCLLNPNRNAAADRSMMEQWLRDYLAVDRIVWLHEGLKDDDTDGHVDNLACFAAPGIVVALGSSDPGDENFNPLQENLQRLRGVRDARDEALDVHVIEQPPPRHYQGRRLAQSYINFYLANDGVVMPAFDAPDHDAAAHAAIAGLFPGREIVQVEVLDILPGGGGIHCITQQQPLPEREEG